METNDTDAHDLSAFKVLVSHWRRWLLMAVVCLSIVAYSIWYVEHLPLSGGVVAEWIGASLTVGLIIPGLISLPVWAIIHFMKKGRPVREWVIAFTVVFVLMLVVVLVDVLIFLPHRVVG